LTAVASSKRGGRGARPARTATFQRRRLQPGSFGATGFLALLVAVGLLMVALGNNAARETAGDAQPLFWGGLVLIYAPIAFRLFSPSTSRTESIALSMLLGGGLFVVKLLYNPSGFILHDELATMRQLWELLETGHFFSANPVVQGYAGYPGLEAVTAALTQISGSSPYLAAMIVIGAARLTLMLGLFLFLERVSGSHRVAAVGMAVYVCNPSFLYFDSQFGYESLALAIAGAYLLVSLRWSTATSSERRSNKWGLLVAMAVLAATLVTTHHLTTYAMLAFLLGWALLILLGRRDLTFSLRGRTIDVPSTFRWDPPGVLAPDWHRGPALPTLFLAIGGAIWLILVAGSVTSNELGSVFVDAFHSIADLITGQSGSKALFEAGNGQTNTAAARILGVCSVIPFLFLIPYGLWRTWLKRGSRAIWRLLALVALLYPVTLGLRLTQAGTETSQRASEFVFVGLAFVTGMLIAGIPKLPNRRWRVSQPLAFAAIATIIFLGGFIVGESPVTRQPGPFLVAGESRSVTPQGVAAAQFADEHLPPRSRIIVDRVNGTLLAAFGHLNPVIGTINGTPVSRVFFSKRYDERDQEVISDDAIDYIVVDRRYAEVAPVSGFYYEPSEKAGGKAVSREALEKFADLEGLDRIYDNGAIAIYDTSGLRARPR
jgi:hypothetical protein